MFFFYHLAFSEFDKPHLDFGITGRDKSVLLACDDSGEVAVWKTRRKDCLDSASDVATLLMCGMADLGEGGKYWLRCPWKPSSGNSLAAPISDLARTISTRHGGSREEKYDNF